VARRRQAELEPVEAVGGFPADLAIGPQVEVWADRGDARSSQAWFRSRRNWEHAVGEWAQTSGWATDRRPASNARSLARTRKPWSSEHLMRIGRADIVDFYEGRLVERPQDIPPGHPLGPS
jgi:hypothetical protein